MLYERRTRMDGTSCRRQHRRRCFRRSALRNVAAAFLMLRRGRRGEPCYVDRTGRPLNIRCSRYPVEFTPLIALRLGGAFSLPS